MRNILVFVCGLTFFGLFFTAGCGTIAKATEKYGATETTVPYTVEQAGPIAEAVVQGYGLKDVDAVITKVDAKVTAKNAEDKEVEVTVTPAGRRTAKIAVSNGAGKDVAEQILAEIEARLESGESVAVEVMKSADSGAVEETMEEVAVEVESTEAVEESVDEAIEAEGGSGADQLP